MHDARSSITLEHSNQYPYIELTEGNHRVHAMTRIGYDKPVPVQVKHHLVR